MMLFIQQRFLRRFQEYQHDEQCFRKTIVLFMEAKSHQLVCSHLFKLRTEFD